MANIKEFKLNISDDMESNKENAIDYPHLEGQWELLNDSIKSGKFNNSIISDFTLRHDETDPIEAQDQRESIQERVGRFFGKSVKYDSKTNSFALSTKDVSDIVNSMTVSNNMSGVALTEKYSSFYKLPPVDYNNKEAIIAHIFHNLTVGDYAKKYLDNQMAIKVNESNSYKDTTYIEPIMPELRAAQKKIEEAGKLAKPEINGFKESVGRFLKKFGLKSWWAKDVDEYDAKMKDWIDKTALPQERELVSKYNELREGIEGVKKNSYEEYRADEKLRATSREKERIANINEEKFEKECKLIYDSIGIEKFARENKIGLNLDRSKAINTKFKQIKSMAKEYKDDDKIQRMYEKCQDAVEKYQKEKQGNVNSIEFDELNSKMGMSTSNGYNNSSKRTSQNHVNKGLALGNY